MTSIIDISKLLLNSSQKTITVQVQRAQCYKMEGGGGGGIVGLMSRNVGRRGEGRARAGAFYEFLGRKISTWNEERQRPT